MRELLIKENLQYAGIASGLGEGLHIQGMPITESSIDLYLCKNVGRFRGNRSGGTTAVGTVKAGHQRRSLEEKGQKAQDQGVVKADSHDGGTSSFDYYCQSREGGRIG